MDKNHEITMIKIVVTGVESSGKTTLAGRIAEYYDIPLVKEYTRAYLQGKNGAYNEGDLVQILEGQLASEQNVKAISPRAIVCDTGPYVIKVWSRDKYHSVDPRILESIKAYQADLFVLPYIDGIEYEEDPLREHPDLADRQRLFGMYLEEMANQNVPFVIPHGSEEERLSQVIGVVNSLFHIT